MVARAGRYYGKGFKGERGVTQGDPLSPTIFQVVVDAVVHHWLLLTTQEAERRGERGRERRHQAALFYTDDGMLESSDPPRTLEILKGYGVGDRVRRLLATYWERTKTVARAGQYYGTGFKGE